MNESYTVAVFCAGIIFGMIVMAIKTPDAKPETPKPKTPKSEDHRGSGTKLDIWA